MAIHLEKNLEAIYLRESKGGSLDVEKGDLVRKTGFGRFFVWIKELFGQKKKLRNILKETKKEFRASSLQNRSFSFGKEAVPQEKLGQLFTRCLIRNKTIEASDEVTNGSIFPPPPNVPPQSQTQPPQQPQKPEPTQNPQSPQPSSTSDQQQPLSPDPAPNQGQTTLPSAQDSQPSSPTSPNPTEKPPVIPPKKPPQSLPHLGIFLTTLTSDNHDANALLCFKKALSSFFEAYKEKISFSTSTLDLFRPTALETYRKSEISRKNEVVFLINGDGNERLSDNQYAKPVKKLVVANPDIRYIQIFFKSQDSSSDREEMKENNFGRNIETVYFPTESSKDDHTKIIKEKLWPAIQRA